MFAQMFGFIFKCVFHSRSQNLTSVFQSSKLRTNFNFIRSFEFCMQDLQEAFSENANNFCPVGALCVFRCHSSGKF